MRLTNENMKIWDLFIIFEGYAMCRLKVNAMRETNGSQIWFLWQFSVEILLPLFRKVLFIYFLEWKIYKIYLRYGKLHVLVRVFFSRDMKCTNNVTFYDVIEKKNWNSLLNFFSLQSKTVIE